MNLLDHFLRSLGGVPLDRVIFDPGFTLPVSDLFRNVPRS
jgi:hypothetical protein